MTKDEYNEIIERINDGLETLIYNNIDERHKNKCLIESIAKLHCSLQNRNGECDKCHKGKDDKKD